MNRLKEIRLNAKLSTRKLESYVGICQSIITCLELEKRPFRQVHIDALTSFLNVSSDYLLGKSSVGIGVYMNGCDEMLFLSEDEYIKLNKYITTSIIEHKTSFSVSIENDSKVIMPKYSIYRELKNIDGVDSVEVIKAKIFSTVNNMELNELKKTLSFIENYIL